MSKKATILMWAAEQLDGLRREQRVPHLSRFGPDTNFAAAEALRVANHLRERGLVVGIRIQPQLARRASDKVLTPVSQQPGEIVIDLNDDLILEAKGRGGGGHHPENFTQVRQFAQKILDHATAALTY